MDSTLSVLIFQGINATGLSAWAGIAFLNNCKAFRASSRATAQTMSMSLLGESPTIDIPLRTRSMTSPWIHRSALLWIMMLQGLASTMLACGAFSLVTGSDSESWRYLVNLGLCCLSVCWLSMLLGGLWFAYWIRQEGLQLTHLVLQLWTLAAFVAFNHPSR